MEEEEVPIFLLLLLSEDPFFAPPLIYIALLPSACAGARFFQFLTVTLSFQGHGIFFPKEAEGRKEGIILTSTKMSTIIFKESSFPPFIGHSNLICPFPSLPFFQWNENIKKSPFRTTPSFPFRTAAATAKTINHAKATSIVTARAGPTDDRRAEGGFNSCAAALE